MARHPNAHSGSMTRKPYVTVDDQQPYNALKTRVYRPTDPDWPGDAVPDPNASVPYRQPISEGPPPLTVEEITE